MSDLKRVYVDVGGWSNGVFYPMAVIDVHPKVWKDKVTGAFVPPENWERFKEFVEVPEQAYKIVITRLPDRNITEVNYAMDASE